MNNIHWFPGHMNKALHEVEEKVKVIDVVIELFDARAPKSSVNEHLEKVIQHKKKLYVFTKADLADPEQTSKWQKHFRTEDSEVLVVNVNDKNSYNSISNAVIRLGKTKWAKETVPGFISITVSQRSKIYACSSHSFRKAATASSTWSR